MRVLFCPVNDANQIWEYAQAIKAEGWKADVLVFDKHPFGYRADINLNLSKFGFWQKRFRKLTNFIKVVPNYDIIHFNSGVTLLPRYLDLPLFKTLKKKLVMNFHGSNARLYHLAVQKNPYYSLLENRCLPKSVLLKKDEENIRRMKLISRYISNVVVPDYELLEYVKDFFSKTWVIPHTINFENIQPFWPSISKHSPIILHAPSEKNLKGTSYVLKAISNLTKYYRFKFMLLTGVSHKKVLQILPKADIVIDQLIIGSYGVFAIEAMAFGKPVICYIREDLLNKFPSELPIVNANPDTIERKLKELIESPKLRREIGIKSRKFVEKYHHPKVVAKKLIDMYNSI